MKEIVIRTLAGLGAWFRAVRLLRRVRADGAPGKESAHPGARLGRRTGADSAWIAVRRMRGAGWTALPYLGRVRGVQVRRWLGRL